jgi:DNA-binding NtrC family response regulator
MNDVPSPVARLILVDDHPLVRDGLRARLEAVPNLEVVGEAGDADEALALAAELSPDLALMDIGMSGMNGIALPGADAFDARQHRIFDASGTGRGEWLCAKGFARDRNRSGDCRSARWTDVF